MKGVKGILERKFREKRELEIRNWRKKESRGKRESESVGEILEREKS